MGTIYLFIILYGLIIIDVSTGVSFSSVVWKYSKIASIYKNNNLLSLIFFQQVYKSRPKDHSLNIFEPFTYLKKIILTTNLPRQTSCDREDNTHPDANNNNNPNTNNPKRLSW